MTEKRLNAWADFKDFVARTREACDGELLFRGQENANWPLATTLERSPAASVSLKRYYRLAAALRSEIEAATNTAWVIPDYELVANKLSEFDPFSLEMLGRRLPGFKYLGYLRHHGFPSPLLDWTRSPFAPAFFAFRARNNCDRAIFVFSKAPERLNAWSAGEPGIFDLSWRVGGHKRHFLQRSSYTICLQYYAERNEWDFAPHDNAFVDPDSSQSRFRQDLLWKVVLPSTLRLSVLADLDEHNLNAFSLFTSEESLMETLATREMEIRGLED